MEKSNRNITNLFDNNPEYDVLDERYSELISIIKLLSEQQTYLYEREKQNGRQFIY